VATRSAKKQKSIPSRLAQAQLLRSLLRQHEEITEQIIALLLHTSAETEQLIQALEPKRNARVFEFPSFTAETQKQ